MSNGPFCDALLFYASYIQSGSRYQLQFSSQLLSHSSFLDWTIVTALWLHFLPISSHDCSLFISLPRSSAFTCCASPSNWLSWRIDQSTALHLDTYSRVSPVLLTWFLDERLPLIVKKCSLHSANGRSQLPAPTCGTTLRTHHICSLQTASQDYCTSIPIGTFWSSLIFLFFWHFPWTLQ